MKKKVLAILLGTCMVLSLVACTETATDSETADDVVVDEDEPEIFPVYLNLEVTDPGLYEVTDDDVDYEISYVLESYSEYAEIIDRAVEEGDVVNLDYTGYMDGEAFESGAGTGYDLTIGSGTFIDGFEDGLIGAEVGETLELELTFPDDYYEDMAGEDVTFVCTINSISANVVPELTDEFVQSVSDTCTTVEEYRTEIWEELEVYYAEEYEYNLQSVVWTAVYESVVITEYPTSIVNALVEQLNESYTSQAEYYGMTLEDLITAYGMTTDEFDAYIYEVACQIYVSNRIVEYIATEQDLDLTDEEYAEEIAVLAEYYGYESADDLLLYADEEDVKMDILTDVVIEWLVENATWVEA